MAQTARELGVSKDTRYGWVRQYHGNPLLGQETVNSEHVYEELERLRREVSIPREERDLLKKAAASASGRFQASAEGPGLLGVRPAGSPDAGSATRCVYR